MKNYFLKLLAITILGTMLACSSDDGDTPQTSKPQSIIKANFTKTVANIRNTFFSYNLGDVVNNFWQAQVSIEGYNSAYTYEIKIKGDVLKKEYSVPLTFEKNDDDASISILNFVKEQFEAEVDTYKAYIIEKESNTELEINIPATSTQKPYIMVDADEDGFLYNFVFSRDATTSSTPLNELNTGSARHNIFFAGSWALTSGLDLSLVFYDLNLTKITKVQTSSYVTDNNIKIYTIDRPALDVIPNSGDYFIRLEGKPTSTTNPKLERNSPYQKIRIVKI